MKRDDFIIDFSLQAVFREDMLRRDIEDLQKRYQVCGISFFSSSFSSSDTFGSGAIKDKVKTLEIIL